MTNQERLIEIDRLIISNKSREDNCDRKLNIADLKMKSALRDAATLFQLYTFSVFVIVWLYTNIYKFSLAKCVICGIFFIFISMFLYIIARRIITSKHHKKCMDILDSIDLICKDNENLIDEKNRIKSEEQIK